LPQLKVRAVCLNWARTDRCGGRLTRAFSTAIKSPAMKSELTDAEQAWMLELNRVGTEEGMEGFPFDTTRLHRNCWLEDFEAGLTPREAIERNKPYEPPPRERNANGKFTLKRKNI
jgi:hypothetical protein